ncbi:nucleopolyhedrovirus P10 family protein [Streptomyces sp. B93]|uniref:nucleopolyhedrovirus P10 family protein n=1 Tax=Streptomyces sp. B93 TaxID=2824875 RepID=UPI001B37E13C|nr:nucleopolyhedrovirus P10 family protein [Streptomyces sp. B93]MBQ1087536.1 nucleopolyhedrovirus P10 family protein [Streptomyces sp. B93]
MTADWTQAVRQQLGLGRLLPLGGPRDGAWLSEDAARTALARAVEAVPGTRLGRVRIGLADPEQTYDPAVPPPPSALPPGPLRLTADFAATAAEPLPASASRLRTALATAAERRLGLTVTEIDLRVMGLLGDDEEPQAPAATAPEPPTARASTDPTQARAAATALAVPGVARLTALLGPAVHLTETTREATLPRPHVQLELAVQATHRTLDVTREVRTQVAEALPDHPTVAVLVTAVI